MANMNTTIKMSVDTIDLERMLRKIKSEAAEWPTVKDGDMINAKLFKGIMDATDAKIKDAAERPGNALTGLAVVGMVAAGSRRLFSRRSFLGLGRSKV